MTDYKEFLNRNKLPQFTPRLDLTAEDLNDEAAVLVKAINELAGRIFIINNMIPEDERTMADAKVYPILDELTRIQNRLIELKENIDLNKDECDIRLQQTTAYLQELETRLNALDDKAATKVELEALSRKINAISKEIYGADTDKYEALKIVMNLNKALGLATDTYSATKAYKQGDIVTFSSAFWECTTPCTGEEPKDGSAYWVLVPIFTQ